MVNERVARLIAEEIKKSDVLDIIKNDKDFEKKVRDIVSDVICDMYRVLWQHNSIFKTLRNK
jgi:hypothetical protein